MVIEQDRWIVATSWAGTMRHLGTPKHVRQLGSNVLVQLRQVIPRGRWPRLGKLLPVPIFPVSDTMRSTSETGTGQHNREEPAVKRKEFLAILRAFPHCGSVRREFRRISLELIQAR